MPEMIGQTNVYVCCSCGKRVSTINLNCGTTPFCIVCPKCNSIDCHSTMYANNPSEIKHAFYLPTKEEFNELPAEMKEFVLHGAMLHGPLCEVTPFRPDPGMVPDMPEWEKFTQDAYGEIYSEFTNR